MRGKHLMGPYSQYDWYHPGPLFYYLLTPLYLFSGGASRSLYWTAGFLNLAVLALALGTFYRHESSAVRRTCFAALLAVALAQFVLGVPEGALAASPLTDIWNPVATVLPLLALLVVAAAVSRGTMQLVPALVLLQALVAQTHVSHAPSSTVLTVVALALSLRGAKADSQRVWRQLGLGLGLGLLLWLPPLLALMQGRYGNIVALFRFAASSKLPGVAPADALAFGLRQLEGMPLRLIPVAGESRGATVIATALFAIQIGTTASCWRARDRRNEPFSIVVAAFACLCAIIGLGQSMALPSLAPQFYYQTLWYGPVGCIAWIGPTTWLLLRAECNRPAAQWSALGLAAAVAGLATATTGIVLVRDLRRCVAAAPKRRPESEETAARLVRPLLEHTTGSQGTHLDASSPDGWGELASVVLQLSKADFSAPLAPHWRFMFGSGARYVRDSGDIVDVAGAERQHLAPLWRSLAGVAVYTRLIETALEPTLSTAEGQNISGDPLTLLARQIAAGPGATEHGDPVILLGASSSVTFSFPLAVVRSLELTADSSGGHVVEASNDGFTFVGVATVPSVGQDVHAQRVELGAIGPWRALRLRPAGWTGRWVLRHVAIDDAEFGCEVSDNSGGAGNANSICDGVITHSKNAARQGEALLLASGATTTIRLPVVERGGFIAGLAIQSMGGDTLTVEAARQDDHFVPVGVATLPPKSRMHWWSFYFNDNRAWKRVRLSPGRGSSAHTIAEIRPIVSAGFLFDFDAETTRAALGDGVLADEVLTTPGQASVSTSHWRVSLSAANPYDLWVRLQPTELQTASTLVVLMNGEKIGELTPGSNPSGDYWFQVPQSAVRESNELWFSRPRAKPGSTPIPTRVLSMLFRPATLGAR
jgi:hypothetical protein